jgi:hypothetical protein
VFGGGVGEELAVGLDLERLLRFRLVENDQRRLPARKREGYDVHAIRGGAFEGSRDVFRAGPGGVIPAMECQPFEHYDYLMLMFRNEQDFQRACEILGIQKVQVTYPGGLKKIGLGRVIDGAKAIERLAVSTP